MSPKFTLLLALFSHTAAGFRFPRAAGICGPGEGSCDMGSCCSESGYCGATAEFCSGSQCQLDYSHSCDTLVPPSGSDTSDVRRERVGNVPYGPMITSCKQPGMVALTFDDGPYIYTSELLDLLDKLETKATFFITGANRAKGHIDDSSTSWPGLLRRMYDSGHQIASHTWTHRDLNQVNETIRRAEIIHNEMAIRNVFGWIPTYIRPPFLECSPQSGCEKTMDDLSYHSISTNLDTKDYMYDDPALIQRAKDRYSSGLSQNPQQDSYIVLVHDVHEQTVRTLTTFMVNLARERGYKLVTVGECLGDPKENWYRSVSKTSARSPQKRIFCPGSVKPHSTSAASARASQVPRSKISPDQTCGGSTGYVCVGSKFGDCCSHYGYCGSSLEFCGTGCDKDFGKCDPTPEGIGNTTNGLCGARFSATCLNYGSKKCCSKFGYCGNMDTHCGDGCQGKYGRCNK